ncbi:MAG: P27 family phage terminase small subunit [Aestuariivirga sp.]
MKGRKPTDVEMKLLSGNPGKRPTSSGGSSGSDAPFTASALQKPDYLDVYASQEWDRLISTLAPILSPASAGMVLVACDAYSEMRTAMEALRDGKQTYETVSAKGPSMTRERPEIGIKNRARTAYHRALAELGASPVAHTRVKKLPGETQPELPGIARMLA